MLTTSTIAASFARELRDISSAEVVEVIVVQPDRRCPEVQFRMHVWRFGGSSTYILYFESMLYICE
jgi:hypothetical protein